MASDTHHHDDHDHGVGHVVPLKFLALIGGALLFLTWLTVAVMAIGLGEFNIYLALAIAAVKASLVVLFFMHLFWDRPFNAFIFVTSIAGVAIFMAFALKDSSEYSPSIEEYRLVELSGGDSMKVQDQLTATQQAIEEARAASEHGDGHGGGEDH